MAYSKVKGSGWGAFICFDGLFCEFFIKSQQKKAAVVKEGSKSKVNAMYGNKYMKSGGCLRFGAEPAAKQIAPANAPAFFILFALVAYSCTKAARRSDRRGSIRGCSCAKNVIAHIK